MTLKTASHRNLFTFSRQCWAKSCLSVVLRGKKTQKVTSKTELSFSSKCLYFYTSTSQSSFHLVQKPHMYPLQPVLSLHLSSSSWFIMPVIQWKASYVPLEAAHCLQGTSGAFVCEARCYQQVLFGCLLPFPLSNLIAAEKWKPYHTTHTPRGVQKWIFPFFYSQPCSSSLI